MKVYSYSEARQKLSQVLNRSKKEDVLIRRRGGEAFVVKPKTRRGSPLDVRGVKSRAKTSDVLAAVREVRRRRGGRGQGAG